MSDQPSTPDAAAEAQGDRLQLEVAFGSARFSAAGPGELVLNAYSAFMERTSAGAATSEEPEPEAKAEPEPEPKVKAAAVPTGGDAPPLPQFMRSHPTRNNQQRAVVMAVWAKRFKDVATFTVDELLKHWRNSGEKLPMKATRDVGLAVSEGWLERLADGDKFQVTSYGERYVDEQLQPKGK
jgi:hypothetical protein